MYTIDHKNVRILLIKNKPLDLLDGVKFVSSSKCGAINTFTGTVRDMDFDTRTSSLMPIQAIHYEVYESMASKQILGIVDFEMNKLQTIVDQNTRAYVALRLGPVAVQEASIIICISSTGRVASHQAVLSILEKIKNLATIWKKIIFVDGHEEWAGVEKSEAFWLQKDGYTQE